MLSRVAQVAEPSRVFCSSYPRICFCFLQNLGSSDFSKSASSPEVRILKMRRPFVLFEPRVSF